MLWRISEMSWTTFLWDNCQNLLPNYEWYEKATMPVKCIIHDQVLSGSYNILWRIDFADGVKCLQVGAVATIDKFDESAAKALDSEVQTMRLVGSL